ncbi:unnamed protein product [Alopecurus aequalis]
MDKKSSRKKKMATTSNHQEDAAVPVAASSLLTDGLIVEILSRLPARSVHRFKPPFCDFHFANVSVGATPPVDPSRRFLPRDEYLYVDQMDTCNGLLLCLAYPAFSSTDEDENVPLESHYVVCNPATKRWVHVPSNPEAPPRGRIIPRLAFDPAASSQFHVLQLEANDQEPYLTGVNIYSSQTGAWKHTDCRLAEKIRLLAGFTRVFLHGMLHLLGWLHPMSMDVDAVLVAVDVEGQVWKTVRVPSGGLSYGTIGLSQGCLHYATTPLVADDKKRKKREVTKIAEVWCMKDYDSKEWVLKHTVTSDDMPSRTKLVYKVAAIHPDRDAIFLDASNSDTLASYDMQHRIFCRILNLKKKRGVLFLPYVPLFSDSLPGADADEQ